MSLISFAKLCVDCEFIHFSFKEVISNDEVTNHGVETWRSCNLAKIINVSIDVAQWPLRCSRCSTTDFQKKCKSEKELQTFWITPLNSAAMFMSPHQQR